MAGLASAMESRDLVSVSRPIFASLGFRLEGFRSRHFEYCKEMVYLNFYNSTIFFCCIFRQETTKTCGKMADIWKNSTQKWWQRLFKKIRQNAQILKSRVSVSNLKSRVSVSVWEFLMKSRSRLEILTRSRSRRLRSRLHHWLVYIQPINHFWLTRFVTCLFLVLHDIQYSTYPLIIHAREHMQLQYVRETKFFVAWLRTAPSLYRASKPLRVRWRNVQFAANVALFRAQPCQLMWTHRLWNRNTHLQSFKRLLVDCANFLKLHYHAVNEVFVSITQRMQVKRCDGLTDSECFNQQPGSLSSAAYSTFNSSSSVLVPWSSPQ